MIQSFLDLIKGVPDTVPFDSQFKGDVNQFWEVWVKDIEIA